VYVRRKLGRHSWRTGLLCRGGVKGRVSVLFRPPIRYRCCCSRDSLLASCFQLQPPKHWKRPTGQTDENTIASIQHCAVLRGKTRLLCGYESCVVTSRKATKQRGREREMMLPKALAIKLLLKEKKNLLSILNVPCVKMIYSTAYQMFTALCTAILLYCLHNFYVFMYMT
jgi:hypothetical protein